VLVGYFHCPENELVNGVSFFCKPTPRSYRVSNTILENTYTEICYLAKFSSMKGLMNLSKSGTTNMLMTSQAMPFLDKANLIAVSYPWDLLHSF
jgi:hypothetical protein